MSDWIAEWKEFGIRPMMGRCPSCKRQFVVEEGMDCECSLDEGEKGGDQAESEEEEEDRIAVHP